MSVGGSLLSLASQVHFALMLNWETESVTQPLTNSVSTVLGVWLSFVFLELSEICFNIFTVLKLLLKLVKSIFKRKSVKKKEERVCIDSDELTE